MVYRLKPEEVDFELLKISNVDKMKVSNSTKYCNHTVAAAMHIIADQSENVELKTTAAFLEDLSRWYDLTTSRSTDTFLNPSNKVKYAADIDHLNMMIKLVTGLKVGLEGYWKPWQSTIAMATAAILRLQNTLIEEGYSEVCTSVLTQDCLESLFGVVRTKQRRPTPLQFKNHLRTIAISQHMQPIKNSSYEMDDQKYLTGFMEYLNTQKPGERSLSNTANGFDDADQPDVPDLSNMDISATCAPPPLILFHTLPRSDILDRRTAESILSRR
ncbi:uncharacterized protein LOC129773858 [Toxorhynchites rutilus septentrionalis]|uniref:uncharacterized protein LOC129773858 n=1 Tax=Toxorhynchites rutilus septentrionalis TaxID=329112 RepID=UPI00247A9E7F|nr:uncharacterized protein LOC129773858 [Toxorhynchites rutilus septentrionalis]